MKSFFFNILIISYLIPLSVYSQKTESENLDNLALFKYEHEGVKQFNSLEEKEAHSLRIGWWREAKFGLFLHWGIYTVPNDPDGDNKAMFNFDTSIIPDSHWQIVTLNWDIDQRKCDLYINEEFHSKLTIKNNTETGISYIRFRSLAVGQAIDSNGILIDWVKADVSN